MFDRWLLLKAPLGGVLWITWGLVFGACQSPERVGSFDLSWRFADHRLCDVAGVSHVEIDLEGYRFFNCWDGLWPHQVSVEGVGLAPVRLQARTVTGAVMYEGKFEPGEGPPPRAAVTLRFVGGR